jgi:RNA polymerase sigma-54 factor
MPLLQNKLNLKLTQGLRLTPGLVQLVSVLALNKLELKDMINAEMVENPVLEELEDPIPLLDEVGRQEEQREQPPAAADAAVTENEKKDSFDEIDFDEFFKNYLDPGFRSPGEMEEIERPSFENFLSKPSTLTDHLMWQLGSLPLTPAVREAAELIIGNLNEDGYLMASDDELMGVVPPASPEQDAVAARAVVNEAAALGIEPGGLAATAAVSSAWSNESIDDGAAALHATTSHEDAAYSEADSTLATALAEEPKVEAFQATSDPPPLLTPDAWRLAPTVPRFTLLELHEGIEAVRQMDPPGVACRDLRECLLYQLHHHQRQHEEHGVNGATAQVLADAILVVDQHLAGLQKKQLKEVGKAMGRPIEAIQAAWDYIRTLDPRPGLQYNRVQTQVIEPDVAFVKHGDEWFVMMNDDDLPQLRLSPSYRRLAERDAEDKVARNYLKEKYKSAIQLIKNIEQRKQTILKVCHSILARQQDFLEKGIDALKPMMIKEVAEEIGVHPSTVSRAVRNKYVHTPQGVFELRYFFSEGVQGEEGGNTSLVILKRRVKKLIEDEDPTRPLTDEQITRILQSQGIQVTRRTVAKYREDMRIPSTHQRRVKK